MDLSALTTDSWIQFVTLIVSVINMFVGIAIAIFVRAVGRKTERVANSRAIYEQWYKKKELSLSFPALVRADWELYGGSDKFDAEIQQRIVWYTLIVDVMFNSYVALKRGEYPEEIFLEDMRCHIKPLGENYPEILKHIVEKRGYSGDGIVGEFNKVVTDTMSKEHKPNTGATDA